MTDLTTSEMTLKKAIAEAQELIAQTKKNIADKTEDQKGKEAEKKDIEEYLLSIKPGCDFITENIDTRKENRAKEKEALTKAIELIKGTPAYQSAVAAADAEELKKAGCKDVCESSDDPTAKCKACLADTTV